MIKTTVLLLKRGGITNRIQCTQHAYVTARNRNSLGKVVITMKRIPILPFVFAEVMPKAAVIAVVLTIFYGIGLSYCG